jgi:hypothetical protein
MRSVADVLGTMNGTGKDVANVQITG